MRSLVDDRAQRGIILRLRERPLRVYLPHPCRYSASALWKGPWVLRRTADRAICLAPRRSPGQMPQATRLPMPMAIPWIRKGRASWPVSDSAISSRNPPTSSCTPFQPSPAQPSNFSPANPSNLSRVRTLQPPCPFRLTNGDISAPSRQPDNRSFYRPFENWRPALQSDCHPWMRPIAV